MEVRAKASYVRIAPRKVRAVVDLIRGKGVREAMGILKFTPNAGAAVVEKVLRSAVANASHNHNLDADDLYVGATYVDHGPTLKRYHPRQRGQMFSILKRTSHVTVVLQERQLTGAAKKPSEARGKKSEAES